MNGDIIAENSLNRIQRERKYLKMMVQGQLQKFCENIMTMMIMKIIIQRDKMMPREHNKKRQFSNMDSENDIPQKDHIVY